MSGLLARLFERRQHPSAHAGWSDIFGAGGMTPAGIEVTPDTGMNSAVVYACVRVLAESVASLPLLMYERLNPGRLRATDHTVYGLMHTAPNPEMTPFELAELRMKFLAIYGNAIMEIERSNGGTPLALWPIHPNRVTLRRVDGALRYEVRLSEGGGVYLRQDQVVHVRGMGSGLWGDSPIRIQMNSIGLDMATEEYGARFFGNGARPGMVLKHPGRLSDDAHRRLSESWSSAHEGLSNAHRTHILEEGMDVDTITIPPEEAQFLETRKFQRSVIAGWYRVPPHMIGDLEHATFSNIEHQGIGFVTHSLLPWLVRIEQALMRGVLPRKQERQRYFIEHLVDGLLRGDTKSRYEAYQSAINTGWMNRNEIRLLENLNPFDGGDEFLTPLNMAGTSGEGQGASGEEERSACTCGRTHEHSHGQPSTSSGNVERRALDEDDEKLLAGRQALAKSHIGLFEDAAGRVIKREVADLRKALKSKLKKDGIEAFREWLDEFYGDLRDVIPGYFEATVTALAEQVATAAGVELDEDTPEVDEEFIEGYLESYAGGYVASHNRQMAALLDEAEDKTEAAELVEDRLAGWSDTQPRKEALGQAFEALNALVISSYTVLGVEYLRWLAVGDSCDFCQSLSGKVAGIAGFFVMGGESLSANGETMLVRRNTRHGPIHGGCDCIVAAA